MTTVKRWICVLMLAGLVTACGRPAPRPALPDTGQHVEPVPGCVELRERGGSC